ncbi:SpoIIE family protein phosphatase [Chitinimonas arctica]|uniref:SpoIIE family protein phosphatase n=1 Tax=Chitinimonas arctica TaxID=2594795 RepID=A0A516SDA0_9NEIS|nr:biofilm regulation protein phosphatase SiaA [Chitinimonas arctica]QDQ26133.1 SpoIIE family protein phosphatase [Chitinimonas arctica]
MVTLGLRGKSLLALLLACVLALLPAAVIGWQVLDSFRNHFGQAYARNTTLLNREKVFAPVSRELALSLRLADSQVTRQWLEDEDNADKRKLFFREAEGYRRDFRDHSYFVVNGNSRQYYFNDGKGPITSTARYRLDPKVEHDNWYFGTMRDTSHFNINVDRDVQLNVTKVWFNVVVHDGDRKIGLAGSGLDLSTFLNDFIANYEAGITPMILDGKGAIQAHPDKRLIAYNSATRNAPRQDSSLFRLLDDSGDTESLRTAMAAAVDKPGSVTVCSVGLNGKPQLLALSYIPELKWHVVTALDLRAAELIDRQWLTPVLLTLAALLVALLAGFAYAVDKLVLRPLRQLQHTAQAMAAGHYEVALPQGRHDEIGQLSAAFGVMARKVRSHTEELENRVSERTRELEQANLEMVSAHKKIDDSIDYASLIQRAILPNHQLGNALGEQHAVLWRPRDVVGGDFYVYRADERGCLLGVVDCAGHGVPGALMTMLAHAALDQAIADTGTADPAAILARTDQIVRLMLRHEPDQRALATNMDVGLAYADLKARELTFAGAKISLFHSDGETVGEVPGGRRAIGDKRTGDYVNTRIGLLAGHTFYLTTDGFLDQAGGELGYGFGSRRFTRMLRKYARLPLAEQAAAFDATLASYQGAQSQRDDITMLCFRFG